MIKTRGLARTFTVRGRPVEAVAGIDLDVRPGELVGFLGPNGAGKTTTLRMLATLLCAPIRPACGARSATSGRATAAAWTNGSATN